MWRGRSTLNSHNEFLIFCALQLPWKLCLLLTCINFKGTRLILEPFLLDSSSRQFLWNSSLCMVSTASSLHFPNALPPTRWALPGGLSRLQTSCLRQFESHREVGVACGSWPRTGEFCKAMSYVTSELMEPKHISTHLSLAASFNISFWWITSSWSDEPCVPGSGSSRHCCVVCDDWGALLHAQPRHGHLLHLVGVCPLIKNVSSCRKAGPRKTSWEP